MKQLFRLTGRYAVMFAAAVLATSTMGSCKKSPQGIDGPDPSGEILPANAGVIEGPTEVEEGSTITLTIAQIERATSYKWYRDGDVIPGQTDRTLTVDDTGAGDYMVSGVNEAGEGVPSAPHTVTYAALTPADADKIQGWNWVTIDTEQTLDFTIQIARATSFEWEKKKTDGTFEPVAGTTKTVDGILTGVLTVEVPSQLGFVGAWRVRGVNEHGEGGWSPEHTLSVSEPPVITDVRITGPTEVMQGGQITLTVIDAATGEPLPAGTSYEWHRYDYNTDNWQPYRPEYPQIVENDNTWVVTSDMAPSSWRVAANNSVSLGPMSGRFDVSLSAGTDFPASSGTISGPTSLVTGQTITLTIGAIDKATSYKWYRNDAEIAGQTATTLSVTTGGTYKVAGVNTAGEGVASPNHVVAEAPLDKPTAKLTITGSNDITDGGTVVLTANIPAGAEAQQITGFNWYLYDGATLNKQCQTGTGNTYTVTSAEVKTVATATYKVKAVNEAGESATFSDGHVVRIPPMPVTEAPVISTAGGATSFVEGKQLILITSQPAHATSCKWFFTPEGSTTETMVQSGYNYSYSATAPGTFVTCGVNSLGDGPRSAPFTVTMIAPPAGEKPASAPTLSADGGATTLGMTVNLSTFGGQLNLTCSEVATATGYRWYLGTSSTPVQDGPGRTYPTITEADITSAMGLMLNVSAYNEYGESTKKSVIIKK